MGAATAVTSIALCALLLTGLVVLYGRYRGLQRRYSSISDVDHEVARLRAEAKRDVTQLRDEANRDVTRIRDETSRDVTRLRDETTRDLTQLRTAVEAEVARLQKDIGGLATERQELVEENSKARAALNADWAAAKTQYDRLRHELSLLEENAEDISCGLYKPHFDFDTSEGYRKKLTEIRDAQKAMVRDGKAVRFLKEWQVGGSSKEGARMQKQQAKLMLRAFNGECDAAIAKVTWNNATRMEERILKAFEAINALGEVLQSSMTAEYLALALNELRLEFELEERKRAESEEQRRIKEQMREEERALREAEKVREEAEAEEARNEKALDKARAEVAKAEGAQLTVLNERIQELQRVLQDARQRKERATTMAQLTKAGHVYIISNLGSFGDDVFKIGMTRRLEPLDRVKELGDASVPFEFDVHAMVYTENAPALEAEFHVWLDHRRVNLANTRKEFFRVSLEEIDAFVEKKNLQIQLTKLAEAREYRQTLALRARA